MEFGYNYWDLVYLSFQYFVNLVDILIILILYLTFIVIESLLVYRIDFQIKVTIAKDLALRISFIIVAMSMVNLC